jgi:hypothetical protein
MVEKADYSARAVEGSVGLELGILPFGHLLATHHPWVHLDREDEERPGTRVILGKEASLHPLA